MKTLRNPWFLTGCIIWIIVLGFRKSGHPFPLFINGYVDDLAAIPVIANLGLWFQRVFIIKSDHYVLSRWHVIFIVIYVSVVFECLLPSFSKVYTADWIDVLLYGFGGIFFYTMMNKPVSS